MVDEQDDWSDELKRSMNDDELVLFKKHITLFKDHFLSYDETRHSTTGSHTGADNMTSLDFISKWQRYEMLNSKELRDTLDRNLLYKTKQ